MDNVLADSPSHLSPSPTSEPAKLPERPEFEQPPKSSRRRTWLLVVFLLLIPILAGSSYYAYSHYLQSSQKTADAAANKQQAANPYADWKTYTSSYDSFSFRYPSDWVTIASTEQFGVTGSDSLQMKSSSGLTVSWFSAVQGIGGGCDPTVMPGTPVSADSAGACPYWYVLDKQKLAGADLYYVAGVETHDGTTYSPWCGVQAADGITKNEGNIGYMLFQGRHHLVTNGHDYGFNSAGLICSGIPGNFGGIIQSVRGSRAQATAYLSTSDFQRAKLILLSLKEVVSSPQQASSTQGWATYADTGYAAASGISFKYPSDWKISVTGVKDVGNTTNPTATINMRSIFLPTAETPQDEWNTCATNTSADACGAAPGDKTVSGSATTINGFAAYIATMQNSRGTYHVAVIRGNKAISGGIPFVELTTYSSDSSVIKTFTAIAATASFLN